MTDFVKRLNDCTEKTTKDGLSRKENRSKIFFVNKKNEELRIIKIDDCFVTGKDDKRCDFMVQHNGINYYIELKAKGWKKPVIQLATSINNLNEAFFDGKKCQPIIVLSRRTVKVNIKRRARKEFDKRVKQGICRRLEVEGSPYHLPLS